MTIQGAEEYASEDGFAPDFLSVATTLARARGLPKEYIEYLQKMYDISIIKARTALPITPKPDSEKNKTFKALQDSINTPF